MSRIEDWSYPVNTRDLGEEARKLRESDPGHDAILELLVAINDRLTAIENEVAWLSRSSISEISSLRNTGEVDA